MSYVYPLQFVSSSLQDVYSSLFLLYGDDGRQSLSMEDIDSLSEKHLLHPLYFRLQRLPGDYEALQSQRTVEKPDLSVAPSAEFYKILVNRLRTTNIAENIRVPADQIPCFPFSMVVDATHNFDERYLIGEGSFGRVFAARIGLSSQKVAFKLFIRNEASPQSSFFRNNNVPLMLRDSFAREVQILEQKRHPNIARLVGYAIDDRESRL